MPLNDFHPNWDEKTLDLDSLKLWALPESVRVARRLVQNRLSLWDLDDLLDPVTLVMSEYVTNAIQSCSQRKPAAHDEKPVVARLRRTALYLLTEVEDTSPRPPAPRTAGVLDEGGRGLALVEGFADHFGWYSVGTGGKVVWAAWKIAPCSDHVVIGDGDHAITGTAPTRKRASCRIELRDAGSPQRSSIDPVVLAGCTTAHGPRRQAHR